ncbi:MAG: hypothetical protein ACE5JA_00195 [bacterium]
MRPKVLSGIVWISFASMFVSSAGAAQYFPQDWVSYTDLRHILSIAADLRFVYFGTRHGICVYDKLKEKWTDPVTAGDGLPIEKVQVVGIDTYTNRLLISSGSKIYSYDRAGEDWEAYEVAGSGVSFSSIGVDQNYIWGDGKDLKIKFDKVTGTWQPVDAFKENIRWFGKRGEVDLRKSGYSFLAPFYVLGRNLERYDFVTGVEDEGILWVGTAGYGVFKYDIRTLENTHLLMGLMGSRVDAMWLDGETFWFGNAGEDAEGITRWLQGSDSWVYYDDKRDVGLFSSRVGAIAADTNHVWMGTEGGLSRFDKKKEVFKTFTIFDGLPANEVTAVCVNGDSLWVGTSFGLCVMDMTSSDFTRMAQVKTWINDLAVSNGSLWVASVDGVFVLDIRSDTWSKFEDPGGLLDVSATRLLFDEGRIWFGTTRGVLSFDKQTGTWERFTYPVHLPEETVRALASDDKNIWVGTRSGVGNFRKDRGEWIKYDQRDGLLGQEVNAIISKDDYVFFGTDRGLTRFFWNNPLVVR